MTIAVIKIILQVLGLQLLVFAFIIFVLWKILNRHLMESAVHQLEVLFSKEVDHKIYSIQVTVPGELNQSFRKRIETAISKKLSRDVPLVVRSDPQMKGGMVIKLGDLLIDCSVISRLKDGGFLKSNEA